MRPRASNEDPVRHRVMGPPDSKAACHAVAPEARQAVGL
jgi:hypothetical protein